MTNVSNASRPPALQPRSEPSRAQSERQGQPAREPKPEDTKAMREAMAQARQKLGLVGEQAAPKQQQGEQGAPLKGEHPARGEAQAQARAAGGDAMLFERAKYERQNDQAFGLPSAAGQLAPIPVPQMPSPVADPSAFAQLMRDLWTRENGKGSKEVRVRFGDGAWPATGARLVRLEDGALDIQLMVAERGAAFDDALPGLEAQLGNAGLMVERLAIADDDGFA